MGTHDTGRRQTKHNTESQKDEQPQNDGHQYT